MRLISVVSMVLALTLDTPAAGQAQSNPYSREQIITLMTGGFTSAEILGRIRGQCLSFQMTTANETELKRAGADAALINGLRAELTRCRPPAPAPAVREDTVLLEGPLPPGWSRVVNQLEPSQNRIITHTRDIVVVISAPGWCPLRDSLVYARGETRRWTPAMQGRSWVNAC